jgi:hypothetical protein
MATDVDVRFLQETGEPNLEVRRHDLTAEELPRFDLIYVPGLLHHLPESARPVARMIAPLRPGGWLLLEEPDFSPVHTSTSELYVRFMVTLTGKIGAASGHDAFWARSLPRTAANQRLAHLNAEAQVAFLHEGSPTAEFLKLSGQQMRETVTASGAISAERSMRP